LGEAMRTAILVDGFRETRSIRVFGEGWSSAAAKFQPAVIAAPLQLLRKFARHAESLGLLHAIVAFTDDATVGLTDSDRDLFWRVFGVPVFEQYLGARNELLAAECEAHAGLHVIGGRVCGALDHGPCACGQTTPRIVPVLEPVLVS
jgi:hypothetical protein